MPALRCERSSDRISTGSIPFDGFIPELPVVPAGRVVRFIMRVLGKQLRRELAVQVDEQRRPRRKQDRCTASATRPPASIEETHRFHFEPCFPAVRRPREDSPGTRAGADRGRLARLARRSSSRQTRTTQDASKPDSASHTHPSIALRWRGFPARQSFDSGHQLQRSNL